MSFQQGLSGLNAASKSLETIGNNVANSNTVGFKGSQAQFADVFASSLNGGSGAQIGIGTQLVQVAQEFTQGNITSSTNPLDIAINGNGFFRLDSNGASSYTRNGQFQLDKDGFIVNANGAKLTGFTANSNGVLSTGAPADLQVSTNALAPQATSGLAVQVNLDSRSTVPTTATFSMADPTSYTNSSSASVYDSLGNSHVMQMFYVATSTAGQWDVYASCDGVDFNSGATIGQLQFNTDGSLDTTASTLPYNMSIDLDAVATANNTTNRATTPLAFTLDYKGSTQYGSAFSPFSQTQDGFAAGRLSGFNIGSDGLITGRYTNGKSATLGQVVLASFKNPNGLQPLGNNMWAETATSGPSLVGSPNSGNFGVLQSSAVEESNVDMTAELVNMITAQRVYQANAQTIKTQDQVLQTLVNLR
ncbi:MAG TPA: flagellar hook protein FlgE [Noviherbaspirillum sp.]